MPTSQLLQILRSLPSEVKQNSSIYDPPEHNMRMKGDQKTISYSHGSYWGEVNSCASEGKEAWQLNDERSGRVFVPFIEFERRDAAKWNPFVTSFSVGIDNGRRESSETERPNGDALGASTEKDSSSLFAKSHEECNVKRSPETETGFNDSATDADKRNVGSDTAPSIVPSKGTTDRFPEDLYADSLDKERHRVTEGGSAAELPLSENLISSSAEGAPANDDGSNGNIDGQSPGSQGSSTGQSSISEKDESKSELVDVSRSLKGETLLANKLPDQEDKEQSLAAAISDIERTEFTQLSSQISANISTSDRENKEGQAPALHVLKDENVNPLKDPAPDPDVGDRSFSSARHITYTGPIAPSGSVSMRSDGSMSGRSFAFPILPSEWNSSPVRMAKADRRNYRKHRGWRSGLFCCGF